MQVLQARSITPRLKDRQYNHSIVSKDLPHNRIIVAGKTRECKDKLNLQEPHQEAEDNTAEAEVAAKVANIKTCSETRFKGVIRR
jgi:hypothetical protein